MAIRHKDPGSRPLSGENAAQVFACFEAALAAGDGEAGAHCLHELWMRNEPPANIEKGLARLWERAGASIPEWLPMRHVSWLPLAYEVAARFESKRRGRSNLYLVLLDYEDVSPGEYGVYVGATRYTPMARFDQHKAGIRAAGSVLKRGLEVLTGPVRHLQGISAREAALFEERLAEALRAEGLRVKGGH